MHIVAYGISDMPEHKTETLHAVLSCTVLQASPSPSVQIMLFKTTHVTVITLISSNAHHLA